MNFAHISRVTSSLALLGGAACAQSTIESPSIEAELLRVGFTKSETACTISVMRKVLILDEINDAASVLRNNDRLFGEPLKRKRRFKLAQEMQDIALVANKVEAFRNGTIDSFKDLTNDQAEAVRDIPEARKQAMSSYKKTRVKECEDAFSGKEIK